MLANAAARVIHEQPVQDIGASLTVAGITWVANGA
jgi:hypothetical protein